MFLNHRNFLRWHFHAQIATRDHHAIAGLKNFFNMLDGLRLLQFRNDWNIAAVIKNKLLQGVYVGSGSHERLRDSVHAMFEPELQVLAIFVRKRRNAERSAG